MANVSVDAYVALANLVMCDDRLRRDVYRAQVAKHIEQMAGKGQIGNLAASEVPNFVQELVNQTGPGPDQLAINREQGFVEPVEETGTVLLGDSSLAEPRSKVAAEVVEDSKQGAANPDVKTADEASKPAKERAVKRAKAEAKAKAAA